MKIARKHVCFFFSFALAVCVPTAPGQSASRLQGVVLDQSGAVVPDALVKLSSLDGLRETKTDESGRFEFADLPSGSYDLQSEHRGFKTGTVESIQVTDKVIQRISITLQIGFPTCEAQPTVSYGKRSDNGNLMGSVNGTTVKSAKLTLTSRESGRIYLTTSNEKGEFQFIDVEPGRYTLRVASDGYTDRSGIDFWVMRENLTKISPIYMSPKDIIFLCA
jgi:hypothetical protein